jgi:hypothetical protein
MVVTVPTCAAPKKRAEADGGSDGAPQRSAVLDGPREASRVTELDSIDNQRLIANGLQHIAYELSLPEPSYFRIAREAHLVLYRCMIEALKGTANLSVTGRLPKDAVFRYQSGISPWREIRREAAPEGGKAWRFSEPVAIAPPALDATRAEEPGEYLVGFYDALAMIETECFMTQVVHSRPVPVGPESMATLEWLHESVRNEYEHFVPKFYSAAVEELLQATEVCVRLSREVLFASGNVRLEEAMRQRLERLFVMLAIRRPSDERL